ncbi:MAG: hypothetical protein WA610_04255 [Thermodesulfovibrionales bacterium]
MGTKDTEDVKRQREIMATLVRKIGVLARIIDQLDAMGLTAREIESILMICGLNEDCAVREGSIVRDHKAAHIKNPHTHTL